MPCRRSCQAADRAWALLAASSQRQVRSVAVCSANVDAMTDVASPRPVDVGQDITTDITEPQYVLDVVIPVFNEERTLEPSLRRLHHFLAAEVPYRARI